MKRALTTAEAAAEAGERREKKKSKKAKEKHKHRSKEKEKGKHRSSKRRSRSASSDSSSSDSAPRVESAARELARLREACALLRELLRAFPDVPRRDVRTLLWSVDAGQGVDLTPLPGACLRACMAARGCARLRC
jgi:hypothetical protein